MLQAHQQTAQLYEQTFGEAYGYPGCSYRGLSPKNFTIEEDDNQRAAVSTVPFVSTLRSMKVCNFIFAIRQISGLHRPAVFIKCKRKKPVLTAWLWNGTPNPTTLNMISLELLFLQPLSESKI